MKNRSLKATRNKKPWPTKEAMDQVYRMKLWGDGNSAFYSGTGSHDEDIVNPYVEGLSAFFKSFPEKLVVCDLGCGDFNIGSKLLEHTKFYYAVDIVSDLIEFNQNTHKAGNLKFDCIDITLEDLPDADCVIIRQVLQHLSNAEVLKVVKKLTKYKYVVLTEHVPKGSFTPNKDIISGQGIRLKKQSGLNLLTAPFNLKVIDEKPLTSYELPNDKGVILTAIYTIS